MTSLRDIFLTLTSETTPSGFEISIIDFLKTVISNTFEDSYGNLHKKIGTSNTMFVCHLDNYCTTSSKVFHFFEKDIVKTKDTILGADDKAGITVLLNLINNEIPGHYVFFRKEEVGCLGSNSYKKELKDSYNKCIAFDRKGLNDMVYVQNGYDTASISFAETLCDEFIKFNIKYVPCKGGMTDSGSFKYKISECVNMSIGYFNNHSCNEYQNLKFLETVCDATVKIDWENIPIFRKIPTLNEIMLFEKQLEQQNLNEIFEIEKELGFSL